MTEALNFFLRQDFESAISFHSFEFLQAVNALLDRLEVSHHAAQPTFVDIEHVSAESFFFDSFLSLLLRTNEEDALAFSGNVTQECVCFINLLNGLLQVDDVDTVTLRKDVFSHLRVPTAGLVSEMNTCFK